MPTLKFRYLVGSAFVAWVIGIVFLMTINATGRLTNSEAIGMAQVWTEVVGFAFAGGSLYFAWRQALQPTLKVSFEPNSDVTRLELEEAGDKAIHFHMRNTSRLGAFDVQALLLPQDPEFRDLGAPRGSHQGGWHVVDEGFEWGSVGGMLGGGRSFPMGSIEVPGLARGTYHVTYWVSGANVPTREGSLVIEVR